MILFETLLLSGAPKTSSVLGLRGECFGIARPILGKRSSEEKIHNTHAVQGSLLFPKIEFFIKGDI